MFPVTAGRDCCCGADGRMAYLGLVTICLIIARVHGASTAQGRYNSTGGEAARNQRRQNSTTGKASPDLLHRPMAQHPIDDSRSLITRIGGRVNNNFYGYWPVYNDVELLPQNLRVYSVGIGGDVTFDRAIANLRNASVACLDPTIDSVRFGRIGGKADSRLKFYPIGLAKVDGNISFFKPKDPRLGSMVSKPGLPGYFKKPTIVAAVRRVTTLMRELGDDHIDFLKVDCEGCEFDIFTKSGIGDLLSQRASSPLQIAIEFHDRFVHHGPRKRAAVMAYLKSQQYVHVYTEYSKQEELLFVRPRPPAIMSAFQPETDNEAKRKRSKGEKRARGNFVG